MSSVSVIGAGLVGCLAALGLSNQGYKVTLFELRDGRYIYISVLTSLVPKANLFRSKKITE